jgi:hypothetical protein
MPRFYFYLRQADEISDDPEGTELHDPAAAQRYALDAARDILADAIRWNSEFSADAILIADERGRTIGWVSFRELLPEHLKGGENGNH